MGLPMAQLPEDLRDIVMPDEGMVWVGWDWDQIELRINAALSNDTPTLEAFEKGWDIHTLNMCDCFGYPHPPILVKPWEAPENAAWIKELSFSGKDDARRVFAKRFVYRLDYGGDARSAGGIPGARTLGLDSYKLVQASNRYLAAHPNKAKWRQDAALYLATCRGTPFASTFLGRKRKLLGGGNARLREYFDYPMQASVSDILNLTVIQCVQEFPWLELMYTMHDSLWLQGEPRKVEKAWPRLREIAQQEWDIHGVKTRIPATFKQQCEVHTDCFKMKRRLA